MGRVGIRTRFLSAHKRAFNSTPIARRVGISTFDYACKLLSVENSEPPAESGNVAWQVVVPPILFFPSSVSVFAYRRRLRLACASYNGAATGLTLLPAHLPCSRLDIHLAAVISADAGGLLPHRFAPDRKGRPQGLPLRREYFLLQLSSDRQRAARKRERMGLP